MNEHETFPEHEVIEVHHQTGCKWFSFKSFADAAMDDGGWDREIFRSPEELAEAFGGEDEIPKDFSEAAKEHGFPLVHVSWDTGYDKFMPESKFDPEEEAKEYMRSDLSSLIVIDTMEEAKYYAEKYKGHEWIKVQSLANRIIEKYAEDED